MNKLLLSIVVGGAALLTSWDGGSLPMVSQADARIGRPLTPFSVAGVHRRVMRRNFGPGWRGAGWHRGWGAAAAVGTAATLGAGWYGDGYRDCFDWFGNWLCGAPAANPVPLGGAYGGWGSGWGAPGVGGWGSGLGWRPGFGVGAPGFGWHRGWGGWGW